MLRRVARCGYDSGLMRPWVPRAALTCVVAVALARALTASSAARPNPITPELARQAYADIGGREPSMRREAALKFAGDPWSADDDFHQREHEAVRKFAGEHDIRIGDVLGAIDDGMHERWPVSVPPIAQVPPCRPRLMY
jgi:hypothetical protein